METFLRDVRHGLRSLLRQPVLSAVLVLSLALGIGANAAIFGVADALLLRSLPVERPEELLLLSWDAAGPDLPAQWLSGILSISASGGSTSTSFSHPAFRLLRDGARGSADLCAFADLEQLNATAGGRAEMVRGQAVSGDYYSVLGVGAALGRTLGPADDAPDAPPAAVLGHAYWRRRFGSDPDVVGSHLSLNGADFTVVGVAPAGFAGTLDVGVDAEVTVPLAQRDLIAREEPRLADPGSWWVQVMARPRPGVSPERMRAALDLALQRSLALLEASIEKATADKAAGAAPETGAPARPSYGKVRLTLGPGGQGLGEARQGFLRPMKVLSWLVGAVLLIACANVASLLLVRALVRRREIATRLAVGGGRGRVVRQLATEALLLALLGGGLGLLAALWGQEVLVWLLADGATPLALRLGLDGRLLAFTAAVSLATGLLFGLAPALRATDLDLAAELKGAAADPRGLRGRSRLGQALVVAQVAVSLALLVGAGLLAGTLYNLRRTELGFNPEGVLLFRVNPTLNGYRDERLAALYGRLHERLAALPGVKSTGFSSYGLLSGSSGILRLDAPPGAPPERSHLRVYFQLVHEDFLRTLEIPRLAGRGVEARDAAGAPRVVVINEALSRLAFGEGNPVGRHLTWTDGKEIEVVGLVRDARSVRLRDEIPPTAYLPYRQHLDLLGPVTFELRTAGDPGLATAAARRAVAQVEPDLPLFEVRTQVEQALASVRQERTLAAFSGFFGLLALALAAIGLYGTMSYAVARRTRETGIRMALGARRGAVAWQMLREALLLVVLGAGLGVAGALASVRLIESLLYGLTPADPAVLAAASTLLLAVAGLAGYLPARRASRVDPMVALRRE